MKTTCAEQPSPITQLHSVKGSKSDSLVVSIVVVVEVVVFLVVSVVVGSDSAGEKNSCCCAIEHYYKTPIERKQDGSFSFFFSFSLILCAYRRRPHN